MTTINYHTMQTTLEKERSLLRKGLVLALLKANGKVTTKELQERFKGSVANRISDLRKEGHVITCKRVSDSNFEYEYKGTNGMDNTRTKKEAQMLAKASEALAKVTFIAIVARANVRFLRACSLFLSAFSLYQLYRFYL